MEIGATGVEHELNIKMSALIAEGSPVRSQRVLKISREIDKQKLRFFTTTDRNIVINVCYETLTKIVGSDKESLSVFEEMVDLGILGNFCE